MHEYKRLPVGKRVTNDPLQQLIVQDAKKKILFPIYQTRYYQSNNSKDDKLCKKYDQTDNK